MKKTKTVDFVVKNDLCTACGGCSGICPKDAISMQINTHGIYTPVIDENKCIDCGLCVKVCPGYKFDYTEHQQRVFGTSDVDPDIGHCIEAWAGECTDQEIHEKSQSGGFVSAMILFCIEKGLADGAIVTKWSEADPFRPELYIAKTRSEVLDAVGSKYNPIPAAKMIKEVLKKEGRYIFVGTPCQIQSFRKAEKINPKIKERIVLYLGLHCLKVFNYHYHDQILAKIHEQKKDISYFRFRDKIWRGWPCDMRLSNKSGKHYDLTGPFSRWWARSYFSNYRCQLCFDKFNEFSDISCGDCRVASKYGKDKLKDAFYNNLGKSDMVIRTERGKKIFHQALEAKVFQASECELKDIIHTVAVAEKKLGLNDFRIFTKIFGLSFPDYGVRFDLTKGKDRLIDILLKPWSIIASAHYYLCYQWIQYTWFRNLLKKMPHKLLFYIAMAREIPVGHVFFRRKSGLTVTKLKDK